MSFPVLSFLDELACSQVILDVHFPMAVYKARSSSENCLMRRYELPMIAFSASTLHASFSPCCGWNLLAACVRCK